MSPSYLRPRDRDDYKESAASCLITKTSHNCHFHIPLMFSFSSFPASIREFFSLFVELFFCKKKYVLVGAWGMLWAGGSVVQWISERCMSHQSDWIYY